VVPLRLRGSVSRSIAFERDGDRRVSRGSEMCTFMPLRGGVNDDPRHIIDLTGDGTVTLQTNQEQAVDAATLEGVLNHPGSQTRTDVLFGGAEPFEWLDLRLTCTTGSGLSRMTVESPAVTSGLVRPQFGRGGPAVAAKGTLAYLTLRPAEQADGPRRYEVGVIGHGPGGGALADQVAAEIRTWDQTYRSRDVRFEIRPLSVDPIEPGPGRFVISWS
ncbi:methyltransferase, FxLD system, partial [Streptosporangium algeriense]